MRRVMRSLPILRGQQNWLALGGEDKLISVSTADGDLRDQAMVKVRDFNLST